MKYSDIAFTTFETPFGITGLAINNDRLLYVRIQLDSAEEFKNILEVKFKISAYKRPDIFRDLIRQFDLYFKGSLKYFNWPLDISLGTHFQQMVWQSLRTIPYGETRSYQWLAHSVGNPKANRAVGNANRKNPLPIIIPCHRIIRKNNQLGGYSTGINIKAYLLHLEGSIHGSL